MQRIDALPSPGGGPAAPQGRQAELLAEIATRLLLSENPKPLLEGIIAAAGREAGAGAFCLHLVDAESAEPRFAAGAGMAGGTLERLEQALRHPGLLGVVLTKRIHVALEDIAGSRDDAARHLAAFGASCCAMLPLIVDGRARGAVTFIASDASSFDEAAMRFLRTIASLLAASLGRARLLSDLRDARDEARAALRAKDDFLAVLSRELRTPLNPVLLIASDAADNPRLPAAVRKDFHAIRDNIRLEARLIDELLDLTQISRGRLVLASGEVDLHAVILDALSAAKGDHKEKTIEARREFAATNARVKGDTSRIRQVFWNILTNAFKFTPDEGAVTIVTQNPPRRAAIEIQITDTGIGMSRQELDSVFNAFGRGGQTAIEIRNRFGGLGLGLAITRMLVRLHGGTIEARSPGPGLGATFVVTFPNLEAAIDEARETPPAERGADAAGPGDGKKGGPRHKVLVVDDHAPTRSALAHLLKRRRYLVTVAAGATEALERARGGEFDLLLSDLGLPDGDGFSVMRLVKDIHPGIRGIAISGYGTDSDLERSRRAGFSAHLVKPVSIKALEKTLAQVAGTVDARGQA